MNEKSNGIVGAIIVAVIVSGANLWIERVSDDSGEKSTAANLATLTERVSNMGVQLQKLADQPYARREELQSVETRVTGLDQRVGALERSASPRK